jgi:alpha-glucoside transport system substrate-binding protein
MIEDHLVVEIFGPYRGQDAVHFMESLEPFEETTGIDILYVGTGSFSHDMQNRVATADYPDIAVFPQPALIRDYVHQGLLVPLDGVGPGQQMSSIDDMLSGVVGGEKYAVWFRAVVKSLVWYSPPIFRTRGYAVPNTWNELITLTARMHDDGTAPWCLSMESFAATGWVGTDWIEDIVLREQGPEVYDAWVAGTIPFADDRIIHAFDTFGTIIHEPGWVFGGTHRILNDPWQDAQSPMFDTDPGCLLNRQASFQQANLPSGVTVGDDTDVFILPSMDGGEPPILASGDLAAMFTDRPEVRALMDYLATPEAGKAWAETGGFTSPHPDFDPNWYAEAFDRRMGEILKEADVVRFDGSDLMIPSVGTGTFWTGMVSYVRNGDAQAAAAEIQAGYPEVTHFPVLPASDG